MSAVPKKTQQEKFQAILMGLLRDEENKYCADCESKGPRWASWNLGIFLCIRCAGIHRNLGVHISRVKSVNLDSWTPEQLSHMMELGNAKAKSAYEANLPDNFRRPQTDSSLEQFIRQKYEQRKYVPSGWQPPRVNLRADLLENAAPASVARSEKTSARAKTKKETSSAAGIPAAPSAPLGLDRISDQPAAARTRTLSSSSSDLSTPSNAPSSNAPRAAQSAQPNASRAAAPTQGDLLLVSLDESAATATAPRNQPAGAGALVDDLFGELVSASPLPQQANVATSQGTKQPAPTAAVAKASADDLQAVFSAQPVSFTASNSGAFSMGTFAATGSESSQSTQAVDPSAGGGAMSTSAILALYGSGVASTAKPQSASNYGQTSVQQQLAGLNFGNSASTNWSQPTSNVSATGGSAATTVGRPNPFGFNTESGNVAAAPRVGTTMISQTANVGASGDMFGFGLSAGSATSSAGGGQTLVSDLWH